MEASGRPKTYESYGSGSTTLGEREGNMLEDERGRKKETKKERTVTINTVFLIYIQRSKKLCPTQKKNFLF